VIDESCGASLLAVICGASGPPEVAGEDFWG